MTHFSDPKEKTRISIAQVQKAKDEWETTLDALPQLICLLDSSCHLLRANKTVERWQLGKVGEVLGLEPHDLLHPGCKDEECYLGSFCIAAQKKISKGASFEYEVEDKRLQRYLRFQAQPVKSGVGKETTESTGFAVLIIHDITESKQADKDRRLLETTLQQADESIMITDIEGIIQYVNPRVELTSGYSRQDLIGQKPSIFKSGKHDDLFYKGLWTTISAKKAWRGSFINKKKNGTLYYEKQTITPILDDKGNIINYISIKRDVTHEVMLEERLRQSLKMEAVGVMAGGIAHEINQPLNSLKVTADGMLFWHAEGKEILPEKTLRKLEKISREADRISETVRHMRSFFRREAASKPVPVTLRKIIHSALSLISERTIAMEISIHEELPESLPPVYGDIIDLEQITLNLIANAIAAIEATEVGRGNITLSGHTKTDGVYLTIRDTGIGIPEGLEEEIFNPLFTTKKGDYNMGLGLAIVRTLLDAIGASISAKNHEKGGAIFTLRFPILKENFKPV